MRRPTEQLLFFFFRTACEAVLDPGNVGFLAHDGALEYHEISKFRGGDGRSLIMMIFVHDIGEIFLLQDVFFELQAKLVSV